MLVPPTVPEASASHLRNRAAAMQGNPLEGLERYWRTLSAGREMPARRDIDPVDIPDLLPYVLMVDVLYDPPDFRYRLMGEHIVTMNRRSLAGWALSGLVAENPAQAEVRDFYAGIVRSRRPASHRVDYRDRNGRPRAASAWLAPLSADGQVVDILFGGMRYDD